VHGGEVVTPRPAKKTPSLTTVKSNIPSEDALRLAALADRNERSLSAELRVAVREHLARNDDSFPAAA